MQYQSIAYQWPIQSNISIVNFTTIAANLEIWLANLPLSIRVPTMLLVSMCHTMPLDIYMVAKNKSKFGLAWSVLLSTTSTTSFPGSLRDPGNEVVTSTGHCSFPKHFFSCFCMLCEFAKFFERKPAYKYFSTTHTLSSPSLDKDFFVFFLW